MEGTYTKLRDGSWGVRLTGGGLSKSMAGIAVNVRKKSGESKQETIDRVLWIGDGVALCSIKASAEPRRRERNIENVYRRKYGWDGVRGSSSYYSSGMYDEES